MPIPALLLVAVTSLPVPFVPQQKDTCGAAALAMVLRYHGLEVRHDAIASALVEPELRGIRGSRLADFARQQGLEAHVFAGDLRLAREHLERGRPLVVAVGVGGGRFHDIVLVGHDEDSREAIVHDPMAGAFRRVPEAEFEAGWSRTGNWTLLVLPTRRDGEEPAPLATSLGGVPSGHEAPGHGYDGLVARAVEHARAGDARAARALLDEALLLEPSRPEARVERGGLLFLEGRYDEAASELRLALFAGEDAYTRDLLASSLHLAGHEAEALAAWNPLGKPALAEVQVQGLHHTRDAVARREVVLAGGETLTPGAVRALRRRLEETGAFDRVTVRTRPNGDGTADLDILLAERHGFSRSPVDFLVTTALNLSWQRLRLRYSNLAGSGASLGASLRWQENRPEAVLQVQWPRPFGAPGVLRLSGFRGEQAYAVGTPTRMRRGGVDASFRHVLGRGAVLTVGVRARARSFTAPSADAPPGLLLGVEAALEQRLVDDRRQRFDLTLRAFGSSRSLGADLGFAQAEGELRLEAVLTKPEGRSVERGVLVSRLRAGWASAGLPIDEMYAPGISPEADLPLRAHPLTRQGSLGASPMGRSVLAGNLEWRQRLLHRPAFDIGAVLFADAARVLRPAQGSSDRLLVDSGLGLRIALVGGPILRIDYAWGLADRQRALFIGLGQVF